MEKRFITIIFLTLAVIYLIIIISSRHPLIVDDINPNNSCNSLLEKADVLYVTPNFKNNSIVDNVEWCNKIKLLNKTIGMHGITHTYHEFSGEISEKEIALALGSFETCFGKKPDLFRPPYNKISKENKNKISMFNLTLYKEKFIQHPYCHCNPELLMKPLNWLLFC